MKRITNVMTNRYPISWMLLAASLCFSQLSYADVTSLTVISGSQRFTIPAFVHERELYASMTELGKRMDFPSWVSTELSKMEIRIGESRLKLTAGNPFVVVVSQKDNTVSEVYQMPNEVLKTDVAYYAPMTSLSPLLARILNRNIALDREALTLTFTGERGALARITGRTPAAASGTSARTVTPPPPVASTPSPPSNTSAATSGSPPAATSSQGSADLAPRAISAETATRYDISHLSVDSRRNGLLIRVHSRKRPAKFESDMDADGRLVLTVNGVTVDENELRQTPTDGESITAIAAEQLGANTRVTFSLKGAFASHKVSRDVRTNDLLLTLYKTVDVKKVVREEQSGGKSGDRTKWKLDCIVIDPGHGGRDPGAIGVSGIKEKNITLGMALKLGKLIEDNMPGVKVVYTRKTDVFVQLDKRGQIANAAGGKLFVSLHCNATERKPSNARGFEVYILRPGRTEEAIRIAEFENSVIKLEKDYETRYAKLTDENFILVNMAQSAYVKYSERFAELLHESVKKSRQIQSKGVKQAGFYVLVGASMPSVLIEAGFLSNAKEEQYLASQEGQTHLAKLFYDAIAAYAVEYEKSLKD